ncbi:MAG: PepSY-associated TM helix domain-containing protein [Planctomycetes bacterium]|nr:PepSY-associated TM helix domain-containing protein [Planctomycetota bacterium]
MSGANSQVPNDDFLTESQRRAIEKIKKPRAAKRSFRWKPFLRALHRDLGCIAFGLTLVYALSGIALHHVEAVPRTSGLVEHQFQIPKPYPEELHDFVVALVDQAEAETLPDSIYPESEKERSIAEDAGIRLELAWNDGRRIYFDLKTGQATETWREAPNPIMIMNWLHAARGKPGWWVIGDTYAVILIILACSGLFLIPRKVFARRAWALIFLGIAIPFLYVVSVLFA